jgi:hypothetical protein
LQGFNPFRFQVTIGADWRTNIGRKDCYAFGRRARSAHASRLSRRDRRRDQGRRAFHQIRRYRRRGLVWQIEDRTPRLPPCRGGSTSGLSAISANGSADDVGNMGCVGHNSQPFRSRDAINRPCRTLKACSIGGDSLSMLSSSFGRTTWPRRVSYAPD